MPGHASCLAPAARGKPSRDAAPLRVQTVPSEHACREVCGQADVKGTAYSGFIPLCVSGASSGQRRRRKKSPELQQTRAGEVTPHESLEAARSTTNSRTDGRRDGRRLQSAALRVLSPERPNVRRLQAAACFRKRRKVGRGRCGHQPARAGGVDVS